MKLNAQKLQLIFKKYFGKWQKSNLLLIIRLKIDISVGVEY